MPELEFWLDAGFADARCGRGAARSARRRGPSAWCRSSAASRCARATTLAALLCRATAPRARRAVARPPRRPAPRRRRLLGRAGAVAAARDRDDAGARRRRRRPRPGHAGARCRRARRARSWSAPAASATRPTSTRARDAGADAWLVASALHDGAAAAACAADARPSRRIEPHGADCITIRATRCAAAGRGPLAPAAGFAHTVWQFWPVAPRRAAAARRRAQWHIACVTDRRMTEPSCRRRRRSAWTCPFCPLPATTSACDAGAGASR